MRPREAVLKVFDDADSFWSDTHDQLTAFFALALGYVAQSGGNKQSTHWRKTERMLMFPEPKEFAPGLSMGHPEGSGTGTDFAGSPPPGDERRRPAPGPTERAGEDVPPVLGSSGIAGVRWRLPRPTSGIDCGWRTPSARYELELPLFHC